eukprot:jgi/Mesen1/4808/ME000243S03986
MAPLGLQLSSRDIPVSLSPAENAAERPITSNGSHQVKVDIKSHSALHSRSSLRAGWASENQLEFHNLSYQITSLVKDKDGRREKVRVDILKNVGGSARTGELMAIMGPSGAGKSTFLDAIAGRIQRESLQGKILLNGAEAGGKLAKMSAYVHQDDQLFAMLTVWETLMFSAGVRLPASVPREDKVRRVQELIEQLGLERVAHTIIGNENRRGVSGGERRRVSIGVDIIHDPAIAFLDEPTSGLDSASAHYVVEKLHSIARAGSLVVCTLHQPSFRILALLDKLVVLARGQVVYMGSPADLPERLRAAGVEVPQQANSAEIIMDLVEERAQGSLNATTQKLIDSHAATWHSGSSSAAAAASPAAVSKLNGGTQQQQGEEEEAEEERGGAGAGGGGSFANGFATELAWLSWRALLNVQRTPPLFLVRIINVVFTSFLLASIFWKPNEGLQGAHNYVAFVAFAVCLVYFTSNDALATFITERQIFIRESSHYAYRASTYVVANMLVFLPFLLLLSVLFTLISWWSVGLAGGAGGFAFFCLVMFCAFFTANSFVSFLSAMVPNLVIGNTVALAITAYFLLLSGFFVKRTEIPKYWLWMHYLSSLKWPYDALVQSQFDRDACYQYGEPETSDLVFTGNATNSPGCTLSGRDVMANLDVGQVNKWLCCVVLVGLGLAYRVAFYAKLRVSSKSKRK